MIEPNLPPVQRFRTAEGLSIAFRHAPGVGPMIVFLPGYMSDMNGGKAAATMDAAINRGQACLLLDYSGCGMSEGSFADGTLSRWRGEVLALVQHVGGGTSAMPALFVGSSMGGWLMLLVAQTLVAGHGPAALHGLVGIAAAPDFIEWGYAAEQKTTLERGEIWFEDNIYGPDPTPYHPAFHADASENLLLSGTIDLTAPVRLLQGQRDPDVPWQIALRLAEAVASTDVRIHLIKDGDHRLSRDTDILLLRATIAEVSS